MSPGASGIGQPTRSRQPRASATRGHGAHSVDEPHMKKLCPKCQTLRPVSEFSKSTSREDGLQYKCKACEAARYQTTKETANRQAKERYQANKELRRKQANDWYYANHERATKKNRDRHWANREQANAGRAERARQAWQRSGSGVHMARVQDWREFFD